MGAPKSHLGLHDTVIDLKAAVLSLQVSPVTHCMTDAISLSDD